MLSFGKNIKFKAAQFKTVKRFNMIANRSEHPAYLVITAFLQNHHPASFGLRMPESWFQRLVVILQTKRARSKQSCLIAFQRIAKSYAIMFLNMDLRRNDFME